MVGSIVSLEDIDLSRLPEFFEDVVELGDAPLWFFVDNALMWVAMCDSALP